MAIKIYKKITTHNPCYTIGRMITIRGLILHSVGCSQPKASVFISQWDRSSAVVGVHGIIDGNDGKCYQCLPWYYRGWHVGGSGNDHYIGIEMCEPAQINYLGGGRMTVADKDLASAKACVKRTYKSAVKMFAYLCKLYNLNPLKDGVILSHKEAHDRGIGSNHGDPEHLWNGMGMSYTMDKFRKAVAKEMGLDSSGAVAHKTPCIVRVKIADLNIRKGAGSNTSKVGIISPGSYTITKIKSGRGSDLGWGFLKSGLGWISLDFVEFVN